MMRNIYVIKDKVMDEVSTIFIANNDNHARMVFENSIAAAKKSGYQSEFALLYVAGIDLVSGSVVPVVPQEVNPLQQDFDFDDKEIS